MKRIKIILNLLISGFVAWLMYILFSTSIHSVKIAELIKVSLIIEALIVTICMRINVAAHKSDLITLLFYLVFIASFGMTINTLFEFKMGMLLSTALSLIIISRTISLMFKNRFLTILSHTTALVFILILFFQPSNYIYYLLAETLLIGLATFSTFRIFARKIN